MSYRTNLPQPGDGTALRNYTQQYQYDFTGNMLQMIHAAGAGSWNRSFIYETASNRLKSDTVGGSTENLTYDLHGNLTKMASLPVMDWNFKDQLQHIDLIGGGNVYFTYDSAGQRIRKVNELIGGLIKERIYLGSFEIYRERSAGTFSLERQTLHVMDDKSRIAMIETRTKGSDSSPVQLQRYQFSNHLGSSTLELDDQTNIISYEEYHPFGTTAYQAINKTIKAAAKRYRYTGIERDEETGLEYHSARYYAPWLARWIKCDPKGINDGINDYIYCSNNPVVKMDQNGTQGTNWSTTQDPNGNPVYQSTGDQATTDLGKVGKTMGGVFLKSDEFKSFKKLTLDPKLAELKTSFGKDWEKDKVAVIIGGVVIIVPTAVLLATLAVENPKLDVPIAGDFYPRQGVFALASLGTGALTEYLTNDRLTIGFGYENKEGKDLYSFELTLKGPKPPDEDKTKAVGEKKVAEKADPDTGGTPSTTPQQKQEDKVRAEINAPESVSISGKVGSNQGEGTLKVEKPTDIGRLSIAPTVKVGPQGNTSFATNFALTSLIAGTRFQFAGSVFVNAPAAKGSPFDVKYDSTSNIGTVTTAPPLTGTGLFVGVKAFF